MSDVINTKKVIIVRDCVVGKICDVCGKEIPPTAIPHVCGAPVYDYYEVTKHHNDLGNDSIESFEHLDVCSPDCVDTLFEDYIHNSAGTRNTKCIEVEHVNCWTLKDTEVSGDAAH